MGEKMQTNSKIRHAPRIRISQSDYERLSALAGAIADRNPQAYDELLAELERAQIVTNNRVPPGTVQMGSTVTFDTDTGDRKTVTLVFPVDADISEGRVSILTPIGTALIGLSTRQAILWADRNGRKHELRVVAVDQPDRQQSNHPAAMATPQNA